MARRDYLSADERTRFDSPPQLNNSQRLILIDLPHWADTYFQAIHTPTAKVGFLLQLGYFRQGRLCGRYAIFRTRPL
jgi:hypothetical protein